TPITSSECTPATNTTHLQTQPHRSRRALPALLESRSLSLISRRPPSRLTSICKSRGPACDTPSPPLSMPASPTTTTTRTAFTLAASATVPPLHRPLLARSTRLPSTSIGSLPRSSTSTPASRREHQPFPELPAQQPETEQCLQGGGGNRQVPYLFDAEAGLRRKPQGRDHIGDQTYGRADELRP